MKRILSTVVLILSVFSNYIANAQACTGGRYHDLIFGSADVSTVTYSTANSTTLTMDIYQPHGDVATQRPVIVFAHGGSFLGGNTTDDTTIVTLCNNFARRGYVTASINYRTVSNPLTLTDTASCLDELAKAISDAKAAIRYFRQDAATNNTYKINPNVIFGGGNDAGAVLFLHLAYIDNLAECPSALATALTNNGGLNGNSGNSGYASTISAVINLAGGLNSPALVNTGDIPSVNFQGDQDQVDPYYCAEFESGNVQLRMCGLGSITPYYQAAGINYQNLVYTGLYHSPWNVYPEERPQIDTVTANFLLPIVCAAYSVTPVSVTTGINSSICSGTTITLEPVASNGTPPYTYAWSHTGNTLSCNNCQNPTSTITTNSVFTVTVTDATNGTASASVNYTVTTCNSSNPYCGNSGPSVCTPVVLSSPGFSPSYDSLPPLINGVSTSTVIHFQNYDTISFGGHTLTLDSLHIDTISNLPQGLCWATNSSDNTFSNRQSGCIVLTGTPCVAPGQYKLHIYIHVYIPFGIELLADAAGLEYYVRVNNAGDPVRAVDTTQTESNPFISYGESANCSGTQSLTVSLGNNQTVCTGSVVSPTVSITNGTAPYTYNWSHSGNSLSCNNCAAPTSTITQTSTFTVTVTDANNSTGTASITYTTGATGTVTINANGPTTFCTGGSVTLSQSGYASYSWSTGATSTSILVTQSGTYRVTVTTNSGCSSTGTISVNAVAQPTAQSIIGNPSITPFQSYTYIVSQVSGITYTWVAQGGAIQSGQGTNSASIIWGSTGPYLVTLIQTNAAGCSDTSTLLVISSTCSLQISINVLSHSPICTGDTVLLIASAGTNGATYQWVKNGAQISGQVSDTLYATSTGNYQVSVAANGCTSLSSVNTVSFLTAPALPIISSNAIVNGCNTQPVTLSLNNTYSGYSWSTGDVTATSVVTVSGSYVITVTGSNGCHTVSAPYNLNLSIISPVEICIVSVDSASGKNIIIWNNPQLTAIDSFLIYKETNAYNVFAKIGGVKGTDFSTFIDINSTPAQQADRYKLAVLDSCGHLTLQSAAHQTIHLSINQGIGNTYNLIWNAYQGFTFPSYYIYRGNSTGTLTQIATIAASNTSYTDLNPPVGTSYYQVGIENPNGCNPSRSADYSQSLSNVVNTTQVGITELDVANIEMYSYYTGSQNVVMVKSDIGGSYELKLIEISGRLVMDKPGRNTEETVLPETLAKGVYIAEAYFTNGIIKKLKVVVR